MLLAGLQSDAIQNPSTETSTSSSSLTIVPQTSAAAVASQKHPRDAQPLKMVETEASKQRKTYAQATVSSASSSQYGMSTLAVATTLIEQPQRQPNQRVVKSTEYLGAFVGHEALTVRMESTRKVEPRYSKGRKEKK